MNSLLLQKILSCLQYKQGQQVVLIKDKNSAFLIDPLAKLIEAEVIDFVQRPLLELSSEQEALLQEAHLVFYAIDKIAEETTLRKKIASLVETNSVNGKLATMFFPNQEMLESAFSADVYQIKKFTEKMLAYVKQVHTLQITCAQGSNLSVEFDRNYTWLSSTGFIQRGVARNVLPAEVYTYPSRVDGVLRSSGINGYLSSCKEFPDKKELLMLLEKYPITYHIENSRIIKVESDYPVFVDLLEKSIFHTDEHSNRIGEIGFGTNTGIQKIFGILAHDEKYPGVHIAYGSPYASRTGAPYDSKVHSDTVLIGATVQNMETKEYVLRDGKYVL